MFSIAILVIAHVAIVGSILYSERENNAEYIARRTIY